MNDDARLRRAAIAPLLFALAAWGWSLATPTAAPPEPEVRDVVHAPSVEAERDVKPALDPLPEPPTEVAVRAVTLVDVDLRVAPMLGLSVAARLAGEEAAAFNPVGGSPDTSLGLAMRHAEASHGALRPFCGVAIAATERSDWPERVALALDGCRTAGARAVFVPRSVGLGVRREAGGLLSLDHESLDVLFEEAFARSLVVVVEGPPPPSHFAPLAGNPSRELLEASPVEHFHGARPDGGAWPTHDAILAALEARLGRTPGPTLLLVPREGIPAPTLAAWLQRHPDLHVAIDPRWSESVPLLTEHVGRVLVGSGLSITPRGVRAPGSIEPSSDLALLDSEHAAIRAALQSLPEAASRAARVDAADTLLGAPR